jgi:hypothetical protein
MTKKKMEMESVFEGIRKNQDKEAKYTQFRMKSSVLDDMKMIAGREDVVYPGRLVHKVLEDFIEKYKDEKGLE